MNINKHLQLSITIIFILFIGIFVLFSQNFSIIPQPTTKAQSSYPQCQQGRITSPCQCGNQIYNAGFCCYHPNANSGIWFDPSYEDILPNGCPTGNFYFVDQNNPNASDENPGTEELPWKNITKAAQTLQAGDIVLVKEGTYIAPELPGHGVIGIAPVNSGEPENPITFKAYPGHTVIIVSDQDEDTYTGFCPAFGSKKDWVVIDGFTVINDAIAIWGSSEDLAEHCTIQNCVVFYNDNRSGNQTRNGIRLENAANCTIRNNLVYGLTLQHVNEACIQLYHTYDIVIENNELYNSFNAIMDKIEGIRNIYRYNLIHDCVMGIWSRGGTTGNDWNYRHQDISIYQNVIYNCDEAINLKQHERCYIYNNLIYNCGRNLYIKRVDTINTRGVEFYNNIISETEIAYIISAGSSAISYMEYNCFNGSNLFSISGQNHHSLSEWQSQTGFDLHSIESDPLFTNLNSHNFHLQPSSPCLNAGIDRQDYDNDGNTTESINMGAYITGNETIGLIDLSQYIVEESQPTTCASQNGVCCQENQICQNGTFISSSDCGNLCCTGECLFPSILGDLDQDNKVNSSDFQILIQKFKETQNIEIEDLNSDGIVDIKDIGILMHYWNE